MHRYLSRYECANAVTLRDSTAPDLEQTGYWAARSVPRMHRERGGAEGLEGSISATRERAGQAVGYSGLAGVGGGERARL